jgi:ankyrin repeat protein
MKSMDFKTLPLAHVEKLMKPNDASLFAIDALNQTVLFYAVQRSSDEEALYVCKTLVDLAPAYKRQDFVAHKDNIAQTALLYAAIAGNLKVVMWLVEDQGLDITASDLYGQSAIFYAARDGKEEIVNYLISRVPGSEYKWDLNGQAPLFYAAREGHTAVCEALIARWPAMTTHIDTAGRRASYFASHAGKVETALTLENAERCRETEMENLGERRQRYRLIFTDFKLLEKFEIEHPEISVWNRDRPVVKRLAAATSGAHKRRSTIIGPRPSEANNTPQLSSWEAAVKRILQDAQRKAEASIFLRTVDEERDGAVDYYKIVKDPMDLGTMTSKLKQGKYTDLTDFKKDLALVWSNTRLYNSPGTFPRDYADKMETWFKQRLERAEEDLMAVL